MSAWPLMAALLLGVALLATRPWWSGAGSRRLRRRSAAAAAYRSRIAELQQEQQAGLLSAADAQALCNELGTRLLADARDEDAAAAPSVAGRRLWPALLLGLVLAAFAGGWYALAGGWQAQRQIESSRAQNQQIRDMVAKLAVHMREHPEDPNGWGMLGRSYFVMQRYQDAASAYAEANTRASTPNPEWLAGQGEALAFARNGDLLGTPAQLFDRALAIDPKFGKALWYAGLTAAAAGDADRARGYWQRLEQDPELAPQMREVIDSRMQELAAAAPAAPAGSGTQAGPGGTALDVQVSLADSLAAKAAPDAVLFVFAKAAGGPPMPLAVQRLPGAKLPLQVHLDDSQAMSPALRLSQFDQYVVTARLSRGGGAQAQSGDLEGSLQVARSQAGHVLALQIDHAVP